MAWAVLLLPPPVFTVSWRLYAVSGLDIFIGLEFLKLEKCLLNLCPDAETDAVFTAVLSAAADKPSFMRIWIQWGYRDVQASHKIQKRRLLHMDIQTITAADIDRMQAADPRTADRSMLKDIRDVNVNTELPKKERMLDFIKQIGNPYCYRHGDYVVKVSFADTDATLEERMMSYMRAK